MARTHHIQSHEVGQGETLLEKKLRHTLKLTKILTVRVQIPQARTPGRERLCIRIRITFLATSEMAEPSMSRTNLGISPEPPNLSQFCLPTAVRTKDLSGSCANTGIDHGLDTLNNTDRRATPFERVLWSRVLLSLTRSPVGQAT